MPRYRFFIKIFLWFWLATIVMVETMGAINRATEPDRFPREIKNMFGSVLGACGQASLEIFEREGVSSLREYLGRLRENTRFDLYLYDKKGNELTGRDGPEGIERLVEYAVKNRRERDSLISGKKVYRAMPLRERRPNLCCRRNSSPSAAWPVP